MVIKESDSESNFRINRYVEMKNKYFEELSIIENILINPFIHLGEYSKLKKVSGYLEEDVTANKLLLILLSILILVFGIIASEHIERIFFTILIAFIASIIGIYLRRVFFVTKYCKRRRNELIELISHSETKINSIST